MNRTLTTFLAVTVLTGLMAALSFLVAGKGYAFGTLGLGRLDSVASAGTFLPLAALYALAGALIVILPLRWAGHLYENAASPAHLTAVVLLAMIIGLQAARFGFGDRDALAVLFDWRFVFAAAIIVAHGALDALRRNALLRSLAFAGFVAAMLACLYFTFRF